jgi:hypothetical protein
MVCTCSGVYNESPQLGWGHPPLARLCVAVLLMCVPGICVKSKVPLLLQQVPRRTGTYHIHAGVQKAINELQHEQMGRTACICICVCMRNRIQGPCRTGGTPWPVVTPLVRGKPWLTDSPQSPPPAGQHRIVHTTLFHRPARPPPPPLIARGYAQCQAHAHESQQWIYL